ncbi:PREDICTED: uncharacterized protein LOC106749428 [Dinoponera quadriceps]|uniref:Uncharacterized protein LOC106749428 n=1 Tax=Dinoponera quadriceps TaxID=609295 RepID=A0A6P3Y2A4_DINQU|nr:PREDICTED: uncharacterized protein LOC106749428 [Dinoponera quadriceps]
MTDEILRLMDMRREYRHKDMVRYNKEKLQREIKRKIRLANEKWFSDKRIEIEKLQRKHDNFNLHRKVKKDKEERFIFEDCKKLERWKEYIEDLFNDSRIDVGLERVQNGPSITMKEIERAIKTAKTRKAVRLDKIPTEILKLLDVEGKRRLWRLFNEIYEADIIPEMIPFDWLLSTFMALPKKNIQQIRGTYKPNPIRIPEQLRNQRDFIQHADFEKTFDRIQHDKLIEILKNKINDKDLRIIKNLYWNQSANVRLGQSRSEDIEIKRGVRQGYILKTIFEKALSDLPVGVKVNEMPVNNLRYADDCIDCITPGELQCLIKKVTKAYNEYELKLNTAKTKVMVINKTPQIFCS